MSLSDSFDHEKAEAVNHEMRFEKLEDSHARLLEACEQAFGYLSVYKIATGNGSEILDTLTQAIKQAKGE